MDFNAQALSLTEYSNDVKSHLVFKHLETKQNGKYERENNLMNLKIKKRRLARYLYYYVIDSQRI